MQWHYSSYNPNPKNVRKRDKTIEPVTEEVVDEPDERSLQPE